MAEQMTRSATPTLSRWRTSTAIFQMPTRSCHKGKNCRHLPKKESVSQNEESAKVTGPLENNWQRSAALTNHIWTTVSHFILSGCPCWHPFFLCLKKSSASIAFGVKSSAKENNTAALGLIYSIEYSKTECKRGVKKEKKKAIVACQHQ